MAVQDAITQHLDIWASAVKTKSASGRGSSKKLDLYGIKKLRELILELAVRGKLVPQDPNDEPASALLKRIETEKARLVEEGKIKKQKPLSPIDDDEKPFELPRGWTWEKLQNLTSYIQRGKGPKYSEFGVVRVVSQKCVQNTGFNLNVAKYVTEESLAGYQPERYLLNDDILWNSTGTGTVGRANVLENIIEKSLVADSHVTVIRPLKVYSRFLWCFIMAPGVQSRIEPSHDNALVSGSTKQVELNTSSVVSVVVPVAPLKEQHRIVAKVDELMALCDQLESQTESSIEAHKTLVETLLATLTNAKDADEFSESWQRINQHFDVLFTTEDSIDQLKQTILQLAVMGKLVKQDPNDEPVDKLIEQLYEEQCARKLSHKERFSVDQEYENAKNSISNNVALIKSRFICDFITKGTTPSKSELLESGKVPFLKVYNIVKNQLDFAYKPIFISEDTNMGKLKRSRVFPNDVVMNIVGPPLGKVAVITNEYPEWNMNQALAVFRPLAGIESQYIYYMLPTDAVLASVLKEVKGTAGQDNLSLEQCRDLLIPIPSVKQQRITVKLIEDLMALCDSLKANLKDAQTTQLKLTNAIVEQVQ